jgi:hypothetical protein
MKLSHEMFSYIKISSNKLNTVDCNALDSDPFNLSRINIKKCLATGYGIAFLNNLTNPLTHLIP